MLFNYAYQYAYRNGDYVLCGVWVVGDRQMLDIDFLFRSGFEADEDWAREIVANMIKDGITRTPADFIEMLSDLRGSYRGTIDAPTETNEFPNSVVACQTLLARGSAKPKPAPAS